MHILFLSIICLSASCAPFCMEGRAEERPFDLQGEIDRAAEGDTILVPPGTYYGNFDFRGKAVVVKSEEGPSNTVLDANLRGSVVTFQTGEDTTSVLEGFTIRNGRGTIISGVRYGGGIFCSESSPKIVGNVVANNEVYRFENGVYDDGGGIYAKYAENLIIRDNVIRDNLGEQGGGMKCWCCSVEITGNMIVRNIGKNVEDNGGGAGGMAVFSTETPQTVFIKDNYIAYNITEPLNTHCLAGGVWVSSLGTVEICDNVFLDNRASYGGGLMIWGSRAKVLHNLFVGNVATGEYTSDPYSGAGGAIWQHWASGPDLVWGNTFYDNEARERWAGGDPEGGAIYSDGLMDISNNIIVRNIGGGIHIYEDFEPYLIRCNDVWKNTFADYHGGAYPGEGDISEDPQLDEMGESTYTLKPTSPCIDAGIDLGYEYFGKAPDMGSWEYDYEGPLPRLKEWFRLEMNEDVPDSVG